MLFGFALIVLISPAPPPPHAANRTTRRQTLSVSIPKLQGNIVYVFELSTPLGRYEEMLPELNRIMDGFELTKLTLGPCSNE